MNNDNRNDSKIRYCSVCRRSEEDAGRLVSVPGGLLVCPDCMQKMMDAANSIDFNKINDMLQSGQLPPLPGIFGPFDAGIFGENNENGAGQDNSEEDGTPEETEDSGETDNTGADDAEDGAEGDSTIKRQGPDRTETMTRRTGNIKTAGAPPFLL